MTAPTLQEIGARVKSAREYLGVNTLWLENLQMLERGTLDKLESGEQMCSFEEFGMIASTMKVPIGVLVFGEDEYTDNSTILEMIDSLTVGRNLTTHDRAQVVRFVHFIKEAGPLSKKLLPDMGE